MLQRLLWDLTGPELNMQQQQQQWYALLTLLGSGARPAVRDAVYRQRHCCHHVWNSWLQPATSHAVHHPWHCAMLVFC